ncbi:MAG: 23S rRNA (guanosine(2251)-2'-O)-methyltransferase RlmB [Leptospirillia bacterium]
MTESGGLVGGFHPVMEVLSLRPDSVVHLYLREDRQGEARMDGRRREIIRVARSRGIPVDFLPGPAIDGLFARFQSNSSPSKGAGPSGGPGKGGPSHQGVVARIEEIATFPSLDDFLESFPGTPPSPLVAVDGVQDPRNLGALLRTCDAAGVGGVLIPRRRVAPLSQTVAKTSAGALFTLPLVRIGNLSGTLRQLKKEGYAIAALDLSGDPLPEGPLPGPLVLVVGAEEKGVTRPVLDLSDWRFRLPMRGKVQSLNLSVAAGIFLYRQISGHS